VYLLLNQPLRWQRLASEVLEVTSSDECRSRLFRGLRGWFRKRFGQGSQDRPMRVPAPKVPLDCRKKPGLRINLRETYGRVTQRPSQS
jgi:hypothetical protein